MAPSRTAEHRLEYKDSDAHAHQPDHQVFSVHTRIYVKPSSTITVHYGADIDLGPVAGELNYAQFRLQGGLIKVVDLSG